MNGSFVDLRLATQNFSHPCVQNITTKIWMLIFSGNDDYSNKDVQFVLAFGVWSLGYTEWIGKMDADCLL